MTSYQVRTVKVSLCMKTFLLDGSSNIPERFNRQALQRCRRLGADIEQNQENNGSPRCCSKMPFVACCMKESTINIANWSGETDLVVDKKGQSKF